MNITVYNVMFKTVYIQQRLIVINFNSNYKYDDQIVTII